MRTPPKLVKETYDAKYSTPNYFEDQLWLYRPFVKALIAKAKLKNGARVLDAGCGQGFFTNLFAENGLSAVGVDLSEVGISSAKRVYGSSGAEFEVGDILRLNKLDTFDCVFTRSCSLYNSDLFENDLRPTEALYSYLKTGGVLIFDYYTKLKPGLHSPAWVLHSVERVHKHFSRFLGAQIYFSTRLETIVLGGLSFCRLSSNLCENVSRLSGLGGELVAFVPKSDTERAG